MINKHLHYFKLEEMSISLYLHKPKIANFVKSSLIYYIFCIIFKGYIKKRFMKRFIILFLFLFSTFVGNAATYTTISSGNWSSASTWSGGNIAPINGTNNETVEIASGNIVTLTDPTSFGSNGTLNVKGTLTLTGNVSLGNNFTLSVSGTFNLNGNLNVVNNLQVTVTGTFKVSGYLEVENNATIDISGTMDVGGNASFDNNGTIHFSSGGTLNVTGNLTGNSNSQLTGTGTLNLGGANSFDGTPAVTVTIKSGLPVELISFGGIISNNQVILNWSTASETNNDFFTIYKSIDGINYEEMQTIAGAGNSNVVLNYKFIDENPFNGVTYYKLKQTDFNGNYKYVGITTCNFKENQDSNFKFANPVINNNMNIAVEIANTGNYQYAIYNYSGQKISGASFELDNNLNNISIPLNNFQNGYYIISINSPDGKTFSYPFVKK